MKRLPAITLALAISLSACGATPSGDTNPNARPLVVTTSSIVADLVERVAGESVEVRSIIPNGFDSHTYEPRPSEIELLGKADLVVLADTTLNSGLTQLAELSGERSRLLDLNKAALSGDDLLYRETSSSWNPHTWTDPLLVDAWLGPITERLKQLAPSSSEEIGRNALALSEEIRGLDREITEALAGIASAERKIVVYHDAWEYFGKRYGLEVVGALQAKDFSEPSAAEIAKMAAQIKAENVKAFFGSEVFPSDVLEALERESGARYVPDLADDRLPGEPGSAEHSYIKLMQNNLALFLSGLQ